MHAELLQLCATLGKPMDSSPPGSFIHGTLQARIPEWVAMPSSRGSSQPRDQTCLSTLAGGLFTTNTTWKAFICLHQVPAGQHVNS